MIGIYKIQNLINGKVYIGQSIDISRRWAQHRYATKNPQSIDYNSALYEAMRKYGIENFQFSILEICLKEELDQKEQFWIKQYHSYINDPECNGYNLTIGGQGMPKGLTKIQQQIKDLWNEGYTTSQIGEKVGKGYREVQHFLKLNEPNYSLEQSRKRQNNLQANDRKVNLYDKNGNYVQTFNGTYDAAEKLNVGYSSILQSIQNKYKTLKDGSFIIYAKLNQEQEVKKKMQYLKNKANQNNRNRPVAQIDINTNKIIHIFSTLKEASLAMSGNRCSIIGRCCNGRGKTAYGYKWSYMYND